MSISAGMSTTAIWKKVCFDDVHIREYGFVLGDNPAVSKGAPLQIGWDYHNEDVIDVDIFEHCREPVRRHRRKIVLSARKRAKILLSAGHTVEEIADMTLQCQTAKRMRVESLKNAGQWDLGNLNVNVADFLSGTAEVTGRTLKLVGIGAVLNGGRAVGNAGIEVVKGTGKIVLGTGKVTGLVVVGTGNFLVGTGKVGRDVVVGTGKLGMDAVVGTGKVGMEVVKGTGNVVVGTGKVATDVVVGTGQFLKKGTQSFAVGTGSVVTATLKGIGKAPRRITNIFSQGDLIRGDDLKEGKEHLKHVEPNSNKNNAPNNAPWSPKQRKASRRQRRHTELRVGSLSPKPAVITRAATSPLGSRRSRGRHSVTSGDVADELSEMEAFMKHLQEMDPDHVKRVLLDPIHAE